MAVLAGILVGSGLGIIYDRGDIFLGALFLGVGILYFAVAFSEIK